MCDTVCVCVCVLTVSPLCFTALCPHAARGHTLLKLNRETELVVNISEGEWLHTWKTGQWTTSSGAWREFCWKNLIRLFVRAVLETVWGFM